MTIGEFDLIQRFFTRQQANRADVIMGIGDDCALLQIDQPQLLAISTDSLVVGTHFLANIAPDDLAYKAFMANLSDLAAMGANPAWLSLALTLESPDLPWLHTFSDTLFSLLDCYHMQLIGGDTTKGALALTLTIQGLVPKGQQLTRSGAKVGDKIYVTGTLGDSAAGLALVLNQWQISDKQARNYLLQRHFRPQARIETGQLLRGIANAAIDISDGLLSDLSHILQASQCGARLQLEQLPLSQALIRTTHQQQALMWALNGGEDYELCFTVPAHRQGTLARALSSSGICYHCIGEITADSQQLHCYDGHEQVIINSQGFDHFSSKIA